MCECLKNVRPEDKDKLRLMCHSGAKKKEARVWDFKFLVGHPATMDTEGNPRNRLC